MWGAINNHDRARFEIHLFSDAVLRESPAGYEAHPDDHIHTLKGLDDTSAADCIRQQGIDVLVDLNGYSYVPRLGLYPLRAAPVQVAWAGMYATSGQDSFDALMTDGVVVPEGEESYYSEPIRRLPGTHLAFDVRYPVPPLAPAPAKAAGKVTFGCLAPLYKLHPTVLSAYAEILKRTPTSRLLFRNRGLNNASNRTWLAKRMEGLGIPADRLVLLGGAEHYLFLETYNQIDIALDTFPYNGGTSTMESLWQGVPCLTFRGRRLIERQSTTLILAAGLGEFVATDRPGFIDLACKVALDARTQEFTDRRLTSRTRLADSQACNTPLLSRSMEKIYVETFEQICGGV
jgi:predicted O-linked N-acetylglucosamine transferase (SPINDLY family)